MVKIVQFPVILGRNYIRALSPALAVKFNISPSRWQHFPLWPLFLQRDKGKRKGKRTEMTGTQHVGTFKNLISLQHHYKSGACYFCLRPVSEADAEGLGTF
jgi:hypothetical protein